METEPKQKEAKARQENKKKLRGKDEKIQKKAHEETVTVDKPVEEEPATLVGGKKRKPEKKQYFQLIHIQQQRKRGR